MFSYFELNFIEKYVWESGFSNFGHVTTFAKQKFVFLATILKRNIFECSFYSFMGVLGIYRYGVSFVPKFLPESTKMVGSKWIPLCTNGSEK